MTTRSTQHFWVQSISFMARNKFFCNWNLCLWVTATKSCRNTTFD